MSRLFYHVMQDNLGNLLFDVTGTMRLAGSGTLATIYGDEAMTVVLPNPMTNHPSFGSFKCFLPVGDFDFYMAKGGYTFETLTGVQGYGGMAQQEANAVAITGGTINGLTSLSAGPVSLNAGNINSLSSLSTQTFSCTGGSVTDVVLTTNQITKLTGPLLLSVASGLFGARQEIGYSAQAGIGFRPTADTNQIACYFSNAAGTGVGAITTTGAATAYATTSDARLKEQVEPLTGALDVVRALNPVSFLWKADGSPGRGLLAHEVAEVVEDVVIGEAGAVEDDGRIKPQMIDYSKLVTYLVGAVKELTQQVEMLTAQLAEASA